MTGSSPTRLTALDSFRGLTVAAMIIVNTPGSGEHVWWPLDHAAWNGFTPTDLIFPAFLCAMGMALGLSFPRRVDAPAWMKIAKRTALLILIGWAWQMLARPGIETFRVYGVLPRLGLCYGFAAIVAIVTARRDPADRSHLGLTAIGIAATLILLGYWAAMTLIPVPGHGTGQLTPEGNLAGYIDRITVGTSHMWRFGTDAAGRVVYDPEGLLSTLPATANVLLGVAAGILWKREPERAIARIAAAGVVLAIVGLALNPLLPINKRLWTSSYALVSSGLAAMLFTSLVIAARSARVRWLLKPFDVFGMNAILSYVLSLLIGLAGLRLGFQATAFGAIDAVLHAPCVSSLIYAVAVTLVVFAAVAPLDRRGIHLRL